MILTRKQQLVSLIMAIVAASIPTVQAQEGFSGKGNYFQQIDTNGDGQVSLDEYRSSAISRAERQFKQMDSNGDGQLNQDEMRAAGEKIRQWMKQHDAQEH